MNEKGDRMLAWTIESVLIGSTVYAVTANLNAWPLVVITVIFTLFLLVVTDKKNQSR